MCFTFLGELLPFWERGSPKKSSAPGQSQCLCLEARPPVTAGNRAGGIQEDEAAGLQCGNYLSRFYSKVTVSLMEQLQLLNNFILI